MEQNTQAFTSGQGRGAATILQPYDPSQDVAQTINIMRTVRQKQDLIKAQKQKDLADYVDLELPKDTWDLAALDIADMSNKYKEEAVSTLQKYESPSGYNVPNSVRIEQKAKGAEIGRLAQMSVYERAATEKYFNQASDGKHDMDKSRKIFDDHIAEAKVKAQETGKHWLNYVHVEQLTPMVIEEVKPITQTDFGTTSATTLGTQKVGDVEVLTTTKTTKERYTPYDVQVDFVSKKTSGVESDMKGTEIQDNLAIGMGFQGGMMDVFEAVNDPKNPRYKEAKLVYDVWVNKAVKKNDVGVTKTASQVRADNNKNSASQNMLLAGVTASKAPVSMPVTNTQGEITDSKYETPSLSLGVDGQSYTTASAEYYDPVKRQFVTTTGTSSTPPMFNANLVYLPFPKSPEKAGWYMYGNVQLGNGWQDAAYKINDKGLQQAMTHKKILTVNDENGSTVDGVDMLEELLLSTGVTKDSKEYKSFEEMSKPIRTANYGKAKKSTMTQNTTTKNNGFAGQAKRAM